MFQLAPELTRDCVTVCDLDLCRVLLMNDSQYPWVILVPMLPQVTEIHNLSSEERSLFWEESDCVSRAMSALFNPYKMNVAVLGNMVPQLHLHHIARYTDDAAWPKPVWGVNPAIPYSPSESEEIVQKLRDQINKESEG